MSDSTLGLLFVLIIVSISLLLSHFVSPYFYIFSIPAVLIFIYALLEELFEVKMPKDSQKSDWSQRPLTEKMLKLLAIFSGLQNLEILIRGR